MSQESTTPDLVELSRGLFDAAQRREFDAILLRYAPDAVWDMNPLGGLGTFEGHAAIRGFWRDWFASYEELEIGLDEILDLGNGVIFAVDRTSGCLIGSTGRVEFRYAIVAVWEEGLIVQITMYTDIDEARAAAVRLAEERG